jgi:hypothetical protein
VPDGTVTPFENVKGRRTRRFSLTLKKKTRNRWEGNTFPSAAKLHMAMRVGLRHCAPIGCTKRLAARTYKSMTETTDLDVELECSSVFNINDIRPFWHVYCLEGLLIEDVRDG